MEAWFALLVGIFFTVAVYLMLSKFIIRMLLGVAVGIALSAAASSGSFGSRKIFCSGGAPSSAIAGS